MGVLLGLLIIVAGLIYFFNSKSSSSSTQRKHSPQSRKNSGQKPTTVKPYSSFNLSLTIEESVAETFQSILKNSTTTGCYQAIQDLLPIVARHNVKCQEIDDYIQKYRPIYLEKIEAQKKASTEWAAASELDKEDLLDEFKENAILELEVRPDCDIEALFSVTDIDLTVDDALIERYEFSLISFYFSKKLGVYIIPTDHYDRKKFECLVDSGLALRGDVIPLAGILEKLTLKEMSALVSDLSTPKFSRKANAIEYLTALPDIKSRVNNAISYRSTFMLVPLPAEFENIDLEHIKASWAYARTFTDLICKTYSAMHYQTQNISTYLDPDLDYKKFSIEGAEDCCSYCMKMAKKKYSRNNLPTIPLHIGCSCTLNPE